MNGITTLQSGTPLSIRASNVSGLGNPTERADNPMSTSTPSSGRTTNWTFSVDNQKYFTYASDGSGDLATWPYDNPFHLILNLAIGGSWGGRNGVDDSISPQRLEIDYVRVYAPGSR